MDKLMRACMHFLACMKVTSIEFNMCEPVFPSAVTALSGLTELRVFLPKV